MKKQITIKQSEELNEKQWKKWQLFWTKRNRLFLTPFTCDECGTLNTPTIGHMIEFLGDKWVEHILYEGDGTIKLIKIEDVEDDLYYVRNNWLCDTLWEAVKEVLGK